ncbi:hypothetical protein CGLO_11177 [Colletotrichum gloeosporioides Cg-14]
MKKEE